MRFSQIGFLLSIIIHFSLLSIPFNMVIKVPSQPKEKKVDLIFEKPKPPPKPKIKPEPKPQPKPKIRPREVEKVREKKRETPPPPSQPQSPIESEVVGNKGIDIPTGKVYEEPYVPVDKPEPPKPKPKPEPKPKVDKGKILREYQSLVIGKIERNKRYPAWAKREGFEGRAYVKFTIFSSGQAENISISSSSGFSILDESAISTVKRASPFPPLPKELDLSQLNLKLAIIFELK